MKKVNKFNILFTSSGRRVSLINKFKEVYQLNEITGKIITTDTKNSAPTSFFSDKHIIVPRVNHSKYLENLLTICKQESIQLIIPLIDTELSLLAINREIFEEIGVKVLVSGIKLNEIACDKTKTYEFFTENEISTPSVLSEVELNNKKYEFPLIIKPCDGSSSNGVTKIHNEKELVFFREYIPNAMVQEFVTGQEYTIDVMLDFQGNIKTIVPRMRIETRAGEVSKGVTKKDKEIIQAVEYLVKSLPEPIGCLTIQCFKKINGDITFIEINPRFGGGIPLSIEAGANFPLWTIECALGERFTSQDFSWIDNLTMLRFDDAVFTEQIQSDN